MRTGDRIEMSSVMMIAENEGLKLHVSHSSAALLSDMLKRYAANVVTGRLDFWS